MKFFQLLASIVVVNGFGEVDHDHCAECACFNDAGWVMDPTIKKCCAPSTWDSFCDGLTVTVCAEECANDEHNHEEAEWRAAFGVESTHDDAPGQEGEPCGPLFSHQRECVPSLHCHQEDGVEVGYCAPFEEVLHELDDDDFDRFEALEGSVLHEVADQVRLEQPVEITLELDAANPASEEEMLADLAAMLRVDVSRLSVATDSATVEATRRQGTLQSRPVASQRYQQYRQYQPYQQPSQPQYKPSQPQYKPSQPQYKPSQQQPSLQQYQPSQPADTPASSGEQPKVERVEEKKEKSMLLTVLLSGATPAADPARELAEDPEFDDDHADAKAMAQELRQKGIDLLCFDWDKTANDEHTYQQTYSSFDQIAGLVSHDFIHLTDEFCLAGGKVAICTYNDVDLFVNLIAVNGKKMIEKVLGELIFPPTGAHSACATSQGSIPVFARNDARNLYWKGKDWHLEQAQKHFNLQSNAATMLLDDTKPNVDEADCRSYQHVWVSPDNGFKFANVDGPKASCPNKQPNTSSQKYEALVAKYQGGMQ